MLGRVAPPVDVLCVSVQVYTLHMPHSVLCRIKLLEAVDHTLMEEAEVEKIAKKKRPKKRKKKALQEPQPAEEETGEEPETGEVEKRILMARTENVIHEPFEQTEEVKVCVCVDTSRRSNKA